MESNWQAWVSIKWKPNTPVDAWKKWENHPKIKGAWSTQGEWDCTFWVDTNSPDEIEKFVWDEVRTNEWVSDTETRWAKKWWMSA